MEVDTEDTETQLITYLENILKCQIIPMNYMNLRDLVEEAPQKMKLYEYIEEKYPDAQFLDFLRKYPNVFTVNPNRTVILSQGNSFTLPYMRSSSSQQSDTSYDTVDGADKSEYISDPETSDSDEECLNEGSRLIQTVNNSGRSTNHPVADSDSSSSDSDSSEDLFSSEIVQTSDSADSSQSSNSS
ncbi:uncharacterized protein CEXT_284501 [Caerostris extrusa]|uniref:Uncharacterized protein n=1 Tax=Caerostris extrusa TaxID=172846 RepID=A0AAV4S9Y4_CAEEX|nr:uncharacterized protein CEXT_284501 [Caerostris extrusa]